MILHPSRCRRFTAGRRSLTKTAKGFVTLEKEKRPSLNLAKLLACCVLALILQAGTLAHAEAKITLAENNSPLEKVFRKIEQQSGFQFWYDRQILPADAKVSVTVSDATLDEALTLCLRNTGLGWKIVVNTIVLSKKSPVQTTAAPAPAEAPDAVQIKGLVLSTDKQPVSDATVLSKLTGRGTVSDAGGHFLFKDLERKDVLVISAIGYQTVEKPVKDILKQGESKGYLYLELERAESKLDEVQIMAYGQLSSRRLNTGSVAKVTAKEIAAQPVPNLLQALSGRMSGLVVNQQSGLPGGDIVFQVRGQNSILGDKYAIPTPPLVIVDGVPYPGLPVSTVVGAASPLVGPNGYGSPLYNLSPSDIESIELLKDADATAIYGSRAANGVLLITTKKGTQGKTKVDINLRSGVSMIARRLDMLNTQEYLALRREAFKNAGRTPMPGSNTIDLFAWDSTRTTNWQDEMLGRIAGNTDVSVGVSGGNAGTSFLLSGNYNRTTTVYPDDRGTWRGGVHFNINHVSPGGKLGVSASALVNVTNNQLPAGNYGNFAYMLAPNYPAYDSIGKLNWETGTNPYATRLTTFSSKSWSTTGNLNLRYTIMPGLDARMLLGYTRIDNSQEQIQPTASLNPVYALYGITGTATYASNNVQTINFEPRLQYLRQLFSGKLDVMVGGTIMTNKGERPITVKAGDFTSDLYLTNLALAGNITVANSADSYQYASLFGRVNYNWKSKYILNGSFRRDGSSRFGPGRRFGNFGALGAAWLFSKESFARHLGWLSFGKLRASYGWVGSDNITNYQYLSTYRSTTQRYEGTGGLFPARIANPDFSWEATKKLEAALEMGFLQDRILLSVAWFRNRTGNQLVQYPISGQAGFTSYQANFSALVQNTGWELELSTVNIKNKNFSWNSSFNMTLPSNKLVRFDNIENSSYADKYVVGNPLGAIYAVRFLGIDSLGSPMYYDANKDGEIDFVSGLAATNTGDRVYIGNNYPKFYGGLTNSFRYKSFQLDFLIQFTNGIRKGGYLAWTGQPGYFSAVPPKKAIEQLRASGLGELFIRPDYNTDYANYKRYSDALYSNASFVRLTNASFSYNLSGKLLQPLRMSSARVYLQAQNLAVLHRFDGFDPETGAIAVPPALVMVAGISCSF